MIIGHSKMNNTHRIVLSWLCFAETKQGSMEQDDSLTNMEWLPDVSLPYMQQVNCKIIRDPAKKTPRKRSRSLGSKLQLSCFIIIYAFKKVL